MGFKESIQYLSNHYLAYLQLAQFQYTIAKTAPELARKITWTFSKFKIAELPF
jgi:hypothetical protein